MIAPATFGLLALWPCACARIQAESATGAENTKQSAERPPRQSGFVMPGIYGFGQDEANGNAACTTDCVFSHPAHLMPLKTANGDSKTQSGAGAMTSKSTSTPASGTPTLFNRAIADWRDLYGQTIRSVLSSMVRLCDEEEFCDCAGLRAADIVVCMLQNLLKERPQQNEFARISDELFNAQSIMYGVRALLPGEESYPWRVLNGAIEKIDAAFGLAEEAMAEQEREAQQVKERTERAIKARRTRKSEAKQEGGAHE